MATLPIVLLHGYPFTPEMWEKVTPELIKLTRVWAPDLNQRDPAPAGSTPSLDAAADRLVSLFDQERIERALVCGFSMGGYIALALAQRHPERLAGLGLINSQSAADSDEARAGRRAMIERLGREGAEAAAAAAVPKLFSKPDPALAAYAQKGALNIGVNGLQWALAAMAQRPDRTEILRQLPVPRLILHSDADQFIPVERAQRLAAQLPGTAYVQITDVGHASPLEAPHEVARAIQELWQRCKT